MPSASQGSTVSFNGSPIGELLNFTVSSPTAATTEVTGSTATVIGSGGDSRAARVYDATAIDSGQVSVRLLGMPAYSSEDIGTAASLSFSTPDGGEAFDAILLSFEVEAAVGELLRGSATFLVMG